MNDCDEGAALRKTSPAVCHRAPGAGTTRSSQKAGPVELARRHEPRAGTLGPTDHHTVWKQELDIHFRRHGSTRPPHRVKAQQITRR